MSLKYESHARFRLYPLLFYLSLCSALVAIIVVEALGSEAGSCLRPIDVCITQL